MKLRLQLDRETIKAYQPVYLGVSAERFVESLAPDIQVQRKDGPALDLGPMEQEWSRAEPEERLPSMGVLLLKSTAEGQGRFLFAQPGEYRLRVKLGPDITSLKLMVEAGPPSDEKAFGELGADHFAALLSEPDSAEPSADLVNLCRDVANKYPDSTASTYCRAYLAIAAFKDTGRINKRRGGKEVWGPIADGLRQVLAPRKDDFFGEEVGYFTAYAQGLSGDYLRVIVTIDSVKTRLTPWGTLLYKMKKEVASHIHSRDVALPPAAGH